MQRTKIHTIQEAFLGQRLCICGWVKTLRAQKECTFIEVNDGSSFAGIQVVLSQNHPEYATYVAFLTTGASIQVKGVLVQSPQGHKQAFELQAESIHLFGTCDPASYPLQKKRHSVEFLRTIAHLRPRTNTQGALLRVRSALAFATHLFFQERGFLHIHTPIITASDCEGGGEQFSVSTPISEHGKHFFGKPAFLTVSGQLNAEILASAMSDVYTFGPTFRAENSNTSRHLAEFWMIEPEMAFATLQDDIECAEAFIHFVTRYALDHCHEDLVFFDTFIEKGLLQKLNNILLRPFARITYTEAIQVLDASHHAFTFPYAWGSDLQSEHERYLAEEHCKCPVIVTDYPKELKAFYMRDNSDQKTVAAMDILVPQIGELVGGSQREERFDILEQKIISFGLNPQDYWWYLELRKYGSVPHAGFGIGFERLLQFITGIENIRDVIPFPRYPGHADF